MGPRNLLILFFSTVAVSLVILIIFFSLFFKNIDLNFNTKLPQSAPNVEDMYVKLHGNMDPDSKAEGLMRSTVNVPPEITHETEPVHQAAKHDTPPSDVDLPPVTDDSALSDEPPVVPPESAPLPVVPPASNNRRRHDPAASPPAQQPSPSLPADQPDSPPAPVSSGPPVPGQ